METLHFHLSLCQNANNTLNLHSTSPIQNMTLAAHSSNVVDQESKTLGTLNASALPYQYSIYYHIDICNIIFLPSLLVVIKQKN